MTVNTLHLHHVGAVQAVDAVGAEHATLQAGSVARHPKTARINFEQHAKADPAENSNHSNIRLHLCAGGACVVAEPVAKAAEVRHDGLQATAQVRLGLWSQATQRKI